MILAALLSGAGCLYTGPRQAPPPQAGPPAGPYAPQPQPAYSPAYSQPPARDQPPAPKPQPVYGQWWFWVGVGVLVGGTIAIVAATSANDAADPCLGIKPCRTIY